MHECAFLVACFHEMTDWSEESGLCVVKFGQINTFKCQKFYYVSVKYPLPMPALPVFEGILTNVTHQFLRKRKMSNGFARKTKC